MRLLSGPGTRLWSPLDRLCGGGRAALIGFLLSWLAACNYTFLAGGADGALDSGPGPDVQVDVGPGLDGGADVGFDVVSAGCGNGTVGPGEECDDGNQVDGDGCSHACQVECCNGSSVDCNYATRGTVNPAAAFVDPDPPEDFCQCAGFENTPAQDVEIDWEGNCLGIATVLRIRYWDTSTDPWTLLGDSTLSPASLASLTPQTFDASDDGGTEGVLETQGLTLFKDDPDVGSYDHETCFLSGPGGYVYQFNDGYFANRTDDKVVWICSASSADRCDPDHELRMGDTYLGECTAPPHHYDLAIAFYRQIP